MFFNNLYANEVENRNSPRTDKRVMVDVVLKGRLLKEDSINISRNGIFLKSKNPNNYNLFDKVTVSFQATASKPIKKTGRVTRKTNRGIGIVFLDEDSSQINWIPNNPKGFYITI